MTMEYKEEEYLQLSGIQHFEFCRRQWALIHIEQQWQENIKTTLGNIAHENCHNDTMKERRKDLKSVLPDRSNSRLPFGGRGLKCVRSRYRIVISLSLPVRDALIETFYSSY